MSAHNELLVDCICELLELEDMPDEVVEIFEAYGFTDEDGNLTQLGETIFTRRGEADDE